jgi:hypothetical protein
LSISEQRSNQTELQDLLTYLALDYKVFRKNLFIKLMT